MQLTLSWGFDTVSFKGENCTTQEEDWYLALSSRSFENTGVAMNAEKTVAIEAFIEVVNGHYQLRNDHIKFPTTTAETAAAIETHFQFHEYSWRQL